nr:MAG TPA: hypothetical protein [Caudoviricetes sp.]
MRGWLFLFHAPALLRAEHRILMQLRLSAPVLFSEARKGVNSW